jgi:hypothetical protein
MDESSNMARSAFVAISFFSPTGKLNWQYRTIITLTRNYKFRYCQRRLHRYFTSLNRRIQKVNSQLDWLSAFL